MTALMRVLVFATLMVTVAATASAQGVAQSFGELRLLVQQGDTVTIVDASGREAKGRIALLTATELVLDGRERRSWQEADVVSVRQRDRDSLGNGALIGLGFGAGGALAGILAVGVESGDEGYAALAVAFYGGIGAGIGVGVDALITRERDVFLREGAGPRVSLQPILARQGGGLRVAVVF